MRRPTHPYPQSPPAASGIPSAGQAGNTDPSIVIPTVRLGGEESLTPKISSSTQKLNVEIRNGTNVAGLGVKLSWALKNDEFSVVKVSNAVMNYPATVIVDLTKKPKSALVKKLEDQLKVKSISKIPPEETSSTAQVLIFIGTDHIEI